MAVYRPTYRDRKSGELKESKTWWYEFVYVGDRIRESANTTRKTVAIEAEKRRRAELERSLAGIPAEKPGNRIQTVAKALRTYQQGYGVNHRTKSQLFVKERSVHVDRLLGSLLLPDLTADQITGYMETRLGEGASNRTVNMELAVLSRAIGQTWKVLWPKTKKLEENQDVGRALEPSEEEALLKAASKTRSPLIYPYLVTLAWTGTRSSEARMLRWWQVDFEASDVTVGKAKTEKGTRRVIPMSATLKAVLEQHAARMAARLGPLQPDWFVFPFSTRVRPVDPTRPVTSLKRSWEKVRKAAKVSCRLHDLRHSFCTKLAEAGVPESTMLDMMGHVSQAMLRRYSHIRAQARRDAIAAVEAREIPIGVPKDSPKVNAAKAGNLSVTH